jgi:hypothetical protein
MKQLVKDKEKEKKEKERKDKKLKELQEKAAKELAENPDAPPIPQSLEEPDRTLSDHLDFGLILPKFTSLNVLSLVYELQEVGLDWEQRMFMFTDVDCLSLANGGLRRIIDVIRNSTF